MKELIILILLFLVVSLFNDVDKLKSEVEYLHRVTYDQDDAIRSLLKNSSLGPEELHQHKMNMLKHH